LIGFIGPRVAPKTQQTDSFFHLHLVSDATGETLLAVGRAAAAQYATVSAIEHVFPLIRNQKQLDHALAEIESYPGIVLYTLVDREIAGRLENHCGKISVPCLSVLGPVLQLFHSYLGAETTPRIGGQHMLNADYFRRIEALNFTMMHDDGQLAEDLNQADVVLVGVSRTSKTPTSIYLANRGIKTANIPLVPGVDPPLQLETALKPLVIGLYASPERIVQIRQNRLLALKVEQADSAYVDRQRVSEEIASSKKLCAKNGWPSIDVSRRSIEETAAAVIALLQDRKRDADQP
jgi:[pyruvate, water dikinase]-phosphate phosphotransferase / [pyruvate, water dikinase] kinase